jgi:hypothetical protein
MPNVVKVSVPFQIQQDEALNRVKACLTEIKTQYGNMVSNLTENWNGYVGTFSGSARGFSVSGTVTVDPSEATVWRSAIDRLRPRLRFSRIGEKHPEQVNQRH